MPNGIPLHAQTVEIPTNGEQIVGDLRHPEASRGVVIFAHGSGSGRNSPRNRQVADGLHAAHFTTLLIDLLTDREQRVDEQTASLRFNIDLLAERTMIAVDWVNRYPSLARLRMGLYGASTGAAAALMTAAARPQHIAAVVSRGGRVDLAGPNLLEVQAPTLLIVGERDPQVRRLNEESQRQLPAAAELAVVPQATHLFAEPGAMEEVAELTRKWFTRHLS